MANGGCRGRGRRREEGGRRRVEEGAGYGWDGDVKGEKEGRRG